MPPKKEARTTSDTLDPRPLVRERPNRLVVGNLVESIPVGLGLAWRLIHSPSLGPPGLRVVRRKCRNSHEGLIVPTGP